MPNPPARRPEVLAQWSRAAMPVEFSSSDGVRRRGLVDVIAQTMHRAAVEQNRRRKVRRTFGAAAAALVGLFLLAAGLLHGRAAGWSLGRAHPRLVASAAGGALAPQAGRDDAASARSSGSPSVAHSPVTTDREIVSRLQLASGVEIVVGADTRLSPPDKDQQADREELILDVGFVQVHVPKLPRGRSFAVRTPDTLVVVHGTSFSVEVTKSGPSALPVTRVAVTVGVVSVRHGESEVLLGSGMEWASSNEAVDPVLGRDRTFSAARPELPHSASRSAPRREATQRSEREVASVAADPSGAPSTANSTPAAEPAVAETDLAEQNRSFAEAVRARERGDLAGAVGLLDNFVRRYPNSPLAQDASVERFRTLERLGDHAAAAREARRYLTLYQNGFARDEARALALEPTARP